MFNGYLIFRLYTAKDMIILRKLFYAQTQTFFNSLLKQQFRFFARDPFPSKVSHYLYRANVINSLRLALRSTSLDWIISSLNDRLLDSFVVTHALRSAPSADSALLIIEQLKNIPGFVHTQSSIQALANVLAKSGRKAELDALVDAVNGRSFKNVRFSFMNLMQFYAALGDIQSVLATWHKYRESGDRVCTESYNIVMRLYAQMGEDSKAVKTFHMMIDEGSLPHSRTYTIVIEHLVNLGKLDDALRVFNVLPLMRIKRTSKQYMVLVEGFVDVKGYDVVRKLLDEMRAEGMLPGRAILSSLQLMKEAGYIDESDKLLSEMLPDKRIGNVVYDVNDTDVDDDDDDDESEDDEVNCSLSSNGVEGAQLKPWLDPRALANALNCWSPNEVSALENAKLVWTTRLVCKILRNFKSPESAWKFFNWVAYQPGFTHDLYTVQRMMTILARNGCVQLVDKLLDKMRREDMQLPFSTIKLIIDFYGISKNPDAALKFFHHDRSLCGPISKFKLMILYSSLLRTLVKCGRNSDALEMADEMILSGICPDLQTFSGLMNHFSRQGDIKTVQKLFSMVRQSGMEPDAYMFKVAIDAYCKCGRASLAWRVFEDMRNSGLAPDAATKNLLVKSLWKEGKRKEAASVEESCECVNNSLPLALRGHIWSVSSADLSEMCTIYGHSFSIEPLKI